MNNEVLEDLLQELTNAANFMRGMTLDPAIPAYVKEALSSKINDIEETLDQHQK